MLQRADKLEAQAKKLMSEAGKARARAKVLGEKTKVRIFCEFCGDYWLILGIRMLEASRLCRPARMRMLR